MVLCLVCFAYRQHYWGYLDDSAIVIDYGIQVRCRVDVIHRHWVLVVLNRHNLNLTLNYTQYLQADDQF